MMTKGSTSVPIQRKSQKTKQDEMKNIKAKLKKKENEIKALEKELSTLRDEYLRQVAEGENQRKRLEREKMEFYQYALAELFKDVLNIKDNFERALASGKQDKGKDFRHGVEMIYKQLADLLTKQGVLPIEVEGKAFDPNFHQAFATEESEDVDKIEVIEEFQKGYILHDRLLRPALVKVRVPKKGK
jgi:molecular chaperone GrpE